MKYARQIMLVAALAIITGAIIYLESIKAKPWQDSEVKELAAKIQGREERVLEKEKKYEKAKEISAPAGYINVPNITIAELIGKKVVIVDFWTYSCINCRRTTPYLNSWYDKYREQGLEIIGVHSPEFGFEKKKENVEKAVKEFGIKYPVVLDNGYATWKAYNNHYWPHKYLIDIDGFIVYDHIGEGGYIETEEQIKMLLKERMNAMNVSGAMPVEIALPKAFAEVDFSKVKSPETYFGANRNEYFANGKKLAAGMQSLELPARLRENALYLGGEWGFSDEYAENKGAAKIAFMYDAKNVYLVAGAEKPVKLNVILDGKPLIAGAGSDVKSGEISVQEERMYSIVEGESYGKHALELGIDESGLKAFAFTFG